jgi:hypothetical protein
MWLIAADTVCIAPSPKLSPLTVTDVPPLIGMFRATEDAMGASIEKSEICVPVTALTVRNPTERMSLYDRDRHLTTVEVVQVDVKQSTEPAAAVTEKSVLPKFRPITVNELPPENA